MSWTGSLPRKWSIRKIWSSRRTSWSSSLRARADARSVPKGFSITMRASCVSPASASWVTTCGKSSGGSSR